MCMVIYDIIQMAGWVRGAIIYYCYYILNLLHRTYYSAALLERPGIYYVYAFIFIMIMIIINTNTKIK